MRKSQLKNTQLPDLTSLSSNNLESYVATYSIIFEESKEYNEKLKLLEKDLSYVILKLQLKMMSYDKQSSEGRYDKLKKNISNLIKIYEQILTKFEIYNST